MTSRSMLTIALVGNPNTGKSTLFTALAGVRQRVGNYPGVTVEKKLGSLNLDGRACQLVDLPDQVLRRDRIAGLVFEFPYAMK